MGRPSELHAAAFEADLDAKQTADRLVEALRTVNEQIVAAWESEKPDPEELQQLSVRYYDLEAALGELRFQGAGGSP